MMVHCDRKGAIFQIGGLAVKPRGDGIIGCVQRARSALGRYEPLY